MLDCPWNKIIIIFFWGIDIFHIAMFLVIVTFGKMLRVTISDYKDDTFSVQDIIYVFELLIAEWAAGDVYGSYTNTHTASLFW